MNYWSNTRFADFVRGCGKPRAGTTAAWEAWEKQARQKHPIRYWIAEEGFDAVQRALHVIPNKWDELGTYLYNRLVSRNHVLRSDELKPGEYYEVSHRMLHCMFDTLVRYVEVESAHGNYEYWREPRPNAAPGTWTSVAMALFGRRWSNPAAGVNRLLWEAELVTDEDYGVEPGDPRYNQPTDQALVAMEVLALYMWWKHTRPSRLDPYADLTSDDVRFPRTITGHLDRIAVSDQNDQEDDEMLVRLARLSRSLWT